MRAVGLCVRRAAERQLSHAYTLAALYFTSSSPPVTRAADLHVYEEPNRRYFGTSIITHSFRQHNFRHDPRSVASLEGPGRWIGEIYPTESHFRRRARDVFKALDLSDLWPLFMPLLIAVPVVMGLSILLLKTGGVMRGLRNIYNLGVKKRDLLGDKAMLALIVFAFTISVYSSLPSCAVRCILPLSSPIWISHSCRSRIVNSFTARGFCRRR